MPDETFGPPVDDGRNDVFRVEPAGRASRGGMSTAVKILLGLLIAGGISFVLCCGGLWYLSTKMKMEFDEDPAAAVATTNEIVGSIKIPAEFQPHGSMDMDIIAVAMKMAVYRHKEADGQLMLMQMQIKVGDPKQQEAELRQQMQGQGQSERKLAIRSSETRDFEIGGETVSFQFAEGDDPESEKAFRQVSGAFPGKTGTAFLMLQIEEEAYDEASIVEMIESVE